MTHGDIITEVRELEKDLHSFKQARDVVHARLREMEGNVERHAMMTDWPAFNVVDNGLILAIVRCEGLLEDYRKLLDQEELPDNVLNLKLEKKP